MITHGSVAKKVRLNKEAHPELYCPVGRCMWRTGGGRCPKHVSQARCDARVSALDKLARIV